MRAELIQQLSHKGDIRFSVACRRSRCADHRCNGFKVRSIHRSPIGTYCPQRESDRCNIFYAEVSIVIVRPENNVGARRTNRKEVLIAIAIPITDRTQFSQPLVRRGAFDCGEGCRRLACSRLEQIDSY